MQNCPVPKQASELKQNQNTFFDKSLTMNVIIGLNLIDSPRETSIKRQEITRWSDAEPHKRLRQNVLAKRK